MGKYYAVANGRSRGVFSNWNDCKSQVDGFPGAKFKSFKTAAEASAFAKSGSAGSRSKPSGPSPFSRTPSGKDSRVSSGKISARSYYGGGSSQSYRGKSNDSKFNSYATDSSYSSTVDNITSPSAPSSQSDSNKHECVWTDGSSLGNGKNGAKAGWGIYWGPNDPRNAYGKVSSGLQTNNRGELEAIKHAVDEINKAVVAGSTSDYEIRADSMYSRDALGKWGDNWARNGWKTSTGSDVKNRDLIEGTREGLRKLRDKGIHVKMSYVQGHAGDHGNEQADALARKGAQS